MTTVIALEFTNCLQFSAIKRPASLSLLYILLQFSFFSQVTFANTNELKLSDVHEYKVLPYLEVMQPTSNNQDISFTEVLHSGDFTPFTGGSIPSINRDVWFRFTINNSGAAETQWVLDFAETLFDDIEFYYRQDDIVSNWFET